MNALVVAITGASGGVYGQRLLQLLRESGGWRTHLVLSNAARRSIAHELDIDAGQVERMADECHDIDDVGAPIASGSFRCAGMVVAPCSMRTLAAIAHGLGDNLITRAADVTLKERRRLVLMARESPLHLAHLRNMAAVTEMGAIVCPPVPAFYARPASIGELVDHSVCRVMDLFGIDHPRAPRWSGLPAN